MSAATSKTAWEAGCTTEAASILGSHRTASCCRSVAECKNGRCWKSLGGRRCSLAPKAVNFGHRRRQTANRRVPTADGCRKSRAPFAPVGFAADSSFRNLPARGRDPLYFPALPRCVGYGRHAATDRKSTRLNSSHLVISYAVFCLKQKQYRS